MLTGLAAVFLTTAVIALFFTLGPVAGADSQRLRLLSQVIPNQAARALSGDDVAFEDLIRSKSELNEFIAKLEQVGTGDPDESGEWYMIRDDMDVILTARDDVLLAHRTVNQVGPLIDSLLIETGNFAGSLSRQRWSGIGRHIERFELAVQRMRQDALALAEGLGDVRNSARRFADDREYLGQVLRGLAEGDATLGISPVGPGNAQARLNRLQAAYNKVAEQATAMLAVAAPLIAAHLAGRQLADAGNAVFRDPHAGTALDDSPESFLFSISALPLYLLLAALLLLILAIRQQSATPAPLASPATSDSDSGQNDQRAILRLLDELGNLADGDLTAQATVSKDITGAIADSINYAIEALRELVVTINNTAVMIDGAAGQTRETAHHQTQAIETQSKQIAAATESVQRMAASIEEVSGNAERSADVARHSVDVAHKGGEAVRRTIEGMNTIRETIQDTAKRIKRLGESSQEIGNFVELINDIAEQTNVLALNASIQASMAGDAGRGFAVVADEVQRLAERSGNATKQIEVLVRTIQSDTNEAVVSMERSTTDVVGGALLAENAGAALDEIEQVSNQISTLVHNISGSARQQATAAADISRNMGVISEISTQTAEATGATFASISKLAELATRLKTTVAGFKLPDEDANVVAVKSGRESADRIAAADDKTRTLIVAKQAKGQ